MQRSDQLVERKRCVPGLRECCVYNSGEKSEGKTPPHMPQDVYSHEIHTVIPQISLDRITGWLKEQKKNVLSGTTSTTRSYLEQRMGALVKPHIFESAITM